jgi:small subunit ribosomal protein S5
MTEDWIPRTRLGRLVKEGKVKTMSEALATKLPLREPEIVDILLPELAEQVLDVNMVQRMTDSGRRVKFAITVVVGNGDGFVGIGRAKSKEVGPGIRQAVSNAKLNMIEIKRGCGSWECGCGKPHTLPFLVTGKSGSVEITLKPAPRGVSLAVGDVAKPILKFAGIEDAWGFTRGHSKTTVNFVYATYNALAATSKYKVTGDTANKLKIVSGSVGYTIIKDELEEKATKEEKQKMRR